MGPLQVAPFYAMAIWPGNIGTSIGLKANTDAQVLDQSDRPIPGLYAAGEILGAAQTSGKSYTGGMQLTPALTFGRLLGERLGEAAARRAAPPPGS